MDLYDLQAKISADTSAHDRALDASTQKARVLADEYKRTESQINSSATRMAASLTPFAKATADIERMKVGNLAAEYDKFSNALSSNSKSATRAADDFLRLIGPLGSTGKAVHEAESGAGKLAEGLRVLASSAVVAEGPMGGVSSRLRALATDASEVGALLGPGGMVVLGLAATTAAAAAAGVGIFELTQHAAEYGAEIYKAQAATGLSARQLSILKVISVETGDSFQNLTTTAARMQVAISRAFTEKGGEAAKALGVLKLRNDEFKNSSPAEQFLKVAQAIQGVTNQSDKNRASLAMVSRGFSTSAEALKEFADQYEETAKKADAFGLILSERDVEAAHKFEVAIKDLGLGIEGFGVQAGERTMPLIENALENLGQALGGNVNSWKDWGRDIGEILAHVVAITEVAASLIKNSLEAAVKSPYAAAKGVIGGLGTAYQTGNVGLGFDVYGAIASQPTRDAGANVRSTYDSAQNALMGMMWNSRYGEDARSGRSGSPQSFPASGGGRKGGGGDPGKQAIQMEQERARETIALFKTEEEAYSRELKQRTISLEQYTADAISLEIKRSDATINELQLELSAAQNIKKSADRELETLKIQNKINDEKRRSAKAISDDIGKLDEDQINRERVYAEMRVSIKDKAAEEEKAVIKNLMDYEVITQAEGAHKLADIEIATLDRRMMLLRSDLEMAGHDLTKRAEIQRQLGELEQERANAVDAGNREVQRARETDLRNFRSYADQLRQMNHDVVDTQLETARRRAELQGSLGVTTPKETRVALAGVDLKVENERFAQYQSDVISKVLALKQEIINIEAQGGEEAAMKKLQIVDEYYAQLKAATEQHEQAIAEIQTRERVRLEEELKNASKQIAGILVHAETTLFKDGWKAAFGEVLQGFLQMILQMETKILASQVLKWLNKLAGIGDNSDESASAGSSGGGGGLLGFVMKWILPLAGAAAGGAAGGSGSSGGSGGGSSGHGRALDGPFGPGQLFPVNELGPEAFFRDGSQDMMWTGSHSGTIIPNSALQKSGDTYHIAPVININVPNIQAAGSGPTQRQVAQQYARLIQQAHT